MEVIWNQEPMKAMRRNMLKGFPCKECKTCYEAESYGNTSMRQTANKHFDHYAKEVLEATHEDGTAGIFKLRYYDIRFSNLCNMSCRTCGDVFSNTWAEENKKRFSHPADFPTLQTCGRHETDMIDQFMEHIPYVEQIYFAGGEPLIMPQHYAIIKKLKELEKFKVRLFYNTNFLKLEYGRDNNILEDWKLFRNVNIGASLDAMGARGEYMRKGTKWDKIIRNRERMMEVCPDVGFYISCTVSLYNVLHIVDFHRDWIERGLIGPGDWHCNVLFGPPDRRVDVLPPHLKDIARRKITEHIQWLKNTDNRRAEEKSIPGFEAVLAVMDGDDKTYKITEFYRVNDELDKYRQEKFDTTFPELIDMKKYK